MNQQNKLALQAGRISECRSSSQNVKAWCKENGISEQTYYRRQKRLFELAKAQQEIKFAEFTPVQPVRSGSVAVTLRIAWAQADIHSGADVAPVECFVKNGISAWENTFSQSLLGSLIADAKTKCLEVQQ